MPKKGQVKYSDLISIRLEPELREILERWAEEEDRSVGSLIRIILREAVRESMGPGEKPKKKS
jgi:hypothetical protein